jgi:hypothetical protein
MTAVIREPGRELPAKNVTAGGSRCSIACPGRPRGECPVVVIKTIVDDPAYFAQPLHELAFQAGAPAKVASTPAKSIHLRRRTRPDAPLILAASLAQPSSRGGGSAACPASVVTCVTTFINRIGTMALPFLRYFSLRSVTARIARPGSRWPATASRDFWRRRTPGA